MVYRVNINRLQDMQGDEDICIIYVKSAKDLTDYVNNTFRWTQPVQSLDIEYKYTGEPLPDLAVTKVNIMRSVPGTLIAGLVTSATNVIVYDASIRGVENVFPNIKHLICYNTVINPSQLNTFTGNTVYIYESEVCSGSIQNQNIQVLHIEDISYVDLDLTQCKLSSLWVVQGCNYNLKLGKIDSLTIGTDYDPYFTPDVYNRESTIHIDLTYSRVIYIENTSVSIGKDTKCKCLVMKDSLIVGPPIIGSDFYISNSAGSFVNYDQYRILPPNCALDWYHENGVSHDVTRYKNMFGEISTTPDSHV